MCYNKRFNAALCAATDKPGRKLLEEVSADIFQATDFRTIDESNGPPVGGYHDAEISMSVAGKTARVKLEVEYSSERFKFDTCHIPGRKNKNTAALFFVGNDRLCWFCAATRVKASPVVNLWTKTEGRTESFFDVDWANGQFARKIDGTWQVLKGVTDPYMAKMMPM